MAKSPTVPINPTQDFKMVGHDEKSKQGKSGASEKSFAKQAQRIIDSIKKSPHFLSKIGDQRDQSIISASEDPPVSKEKVFFILYKGKIQVRGTRIHDAINGISQLVTDPTLYAPTCRTEKGENIHDNYAAELSTVKANMSEILVNGNGVNVRLPLMDLAFCATDLRVPQVVSIVTNRGNDYFCYALVCANRVKSRELVNHINQTFETVWREWKRREKQEFRREDEKKVEAEMEYMERKRRAAGKGKSSGDKNRTK